MAETTRFPVPPSRRGVVSAVGAAGLAAVLTACGSDSDSDSDSDSGSNSGTTAPPSPASPSSPGGGAEPLAKTSEIPVGGGKVFADQKVVVTQPTAGHFKGFSATCTHRGCTVVSVSDGTINCPCHGSKFRVADGSVARGPAVTPLPAQQITVSGDEVTLA
jgi:Rieske Fe-S protein